MRKNQNKFRDYLTFSRGGKTATMGYSNIKRVFALGETGKLSKLRGGKVTVNPFAFTVLLCMAANCYDYPATGTIANKSLACRYYQRGWRHIAKSLGMIQLPNGNKRFQPDLDVASIVRSRENTAQNRISQAWKFLQEQGLIKCIEPASLGKNAGYLLTIADDEENRKVEDWARYCLGITDTLGECQQSSSITPKEKPQAPVRHFIGFRS
ncbi:hypothetical protein ACMZ87_03175 [Gardnerella pickettii]|uniref:hypothetical protein n=1 Tax=Gardnerella pickettii TaxID=2914924 RepID=UPI0039EE3749